MERRSSFVVLESVAGSILDIWRIVMPKQMTTKPMTRVMIDVTEALRPLKRI